MINSGRVITVQVETAAQRRTRTRRLRARQRKAKKAAFNMRSQHLEEMDMTPRTDWRGRPIPRSSGFDGVGWCETAWDDVPTPGCGEALFVRP